MYPIRCAALNRFDENWCVVRLPVFTQIGPIPHELHVNAKQKCRKSAARWYRHLRRLRHLRHSDRVHSQIRVTACRLSQLRKNRTPSSFGIRRAFVHVVKKQGLDANEWLNKAGWLWSWLWMQLWNWLARWIWNPSSALGKPLRSHHPERMRS